VDRLTDEVISAITSKVIESWLESLKMNRLTKLSSNKDSAVQQVSKPHFSNECRKWRQYRKLSQLDLALSANISQRHLSYLETGRSSPSREMVIRLCDAMDVPLRERNFLLRSAGFSELYTEHSFDEPSMTPVVDALNFMMKHHDPYPAIVVDRFWDVKMKNQAAEALFTSLMQIPSLLSLIQESGSMNIAQLTLHPKSLRQLIINWDEAAPQFIRRIACECKVSGDVEVQSRLQSYLIDAGYSVQNEQIAEHLLPVIPLKIALNGVQLSMFSVISTFGTAQDITTDELRIETFYPADKPTEYFFQQLPLSPLLSQ
jgi:transcriptional regulator with XRE-family HTH domain